jgi:hypothetical protein
MSRTKKGVGDMSEEDYRAIAKIIEEVVGKDTLQGIKLLQGVQFYFDNKVEKISIVNEKLSQSDPLDLRKVRIFSDEADKAMKRYTKKLNKETEKLKAKGKYCGVSE